MNNLSVQERYTRKARLYQKFFVDFLHWENVLEAFFQENLLLRSSMKILDAGCGTGPVTLTLHRLARLQGLERITYHGFDLTPAMLDVFQQRINQEGISDVHLLQADVLDLENQLPTDWGGYDLIVSSAMLEYIPEAKRSLALSNLMRRLGKHGFCLIFATKKTWIARWVGAKWWGTNLFDQDGLAADLHRAGFEKLQFKKLPSGWSLFMWAVQAYPPDYEGSM